MHHRNRDGREQSQAVIGSADRTALGVWLLTRLGVVVIAVAASRILAFGDLRDTFLDRWTQWDVDLLVEIAEYGYDGNPAEPPDPGLPAFFPGYPLLLRAVHVVVPDWRAAALLITLIAGAIAMVALARLGESTGPVGSGPHAVFALLVSPAAVFLFAGYTEALFLAFALPAWLLARQGRWELAVLCAAAAAGVRITGLFLAVALLTEFLVGARGRRVPGGWRRLPLLVVPFLPPLVYSAYQWRRTGDPLAWSHAQEAGWGRVLVPPWQALRTTWDAAFAVNNQFTWAFRVELVAAAVGVALTLWLLRRRRWAESVYLGLQLAALLTSAFYLSIGRATLLWWPLWLAVGALGARHRWAYIAFVVVSTPIMVIQLVLFTAGRWAG